MEGSRGGGGSHRGVAGVGDGEGGEGVGDGDGGGAGRGRGVASDDGDGGGRSWRRGVAGRAQGQQTATAWAANDVSMGSGVADGDGVGSGAWATAARQPGGVEEVGIVGGNWQ
nr:rRNA/tRNA 2'-O-methyltransferase fibrillarin-like protein 1 [Aegilops tauschii subsp. strangulata]